MATDAATTLTIEHAGLTPGRLPALDSRPGPFASFRATRRVRVWDSTPRHDIALDQATQGPTGRCRYCSLPVVGTSSNRPRTRDSARPLTDRSGRWFQRLLGTGPFSRDSCGATLDGFVERVLQVGQPQQQRQTTARHQQGNQQRQQELAHRDKPPPCFCCDDFCPEGRGVVTPSSRSCAVPAALRWSAAGAGR